jgi:Carboxypeptidase regulatory-like domain/TonB dependent receptor-like, beta-barrel
MTKQLRVALLALALAMGAVAAFGQATEGSILGTVLDPSGATMPGVRIDVTNTETGQHRLTLTNESGEYVVTNVPPGMYSVAAEKAGFKRAVQPPVEMTVKARVRVDLHMVVGEASQSVQVNGAAPELRTDSAEVSTLVSRNELASLPVFDRHLLALQVLTPGTFRRWPNEGGDRIGDFSGGESMQVAGLGSGQNNFILDGVSNNVELTGGMNAVPAMDAVQEFSIQTNAYSAEFGRAAGAVVNVALRSGSNELHGFGYDYLQNDFFDARPYDFTGTNPAIAPLRKNLFGGGAGGPIKRNHIFWFANYEGLRQPSGVIEQDTVPTAAERDGDFSQSGWTVYDPATLHTDASGNQVRDPFPGNIIPAARINSMMHTLIGIYPLPNYKDPNPSVLSNYQALDINNDSKDSFSAKGDIVASAADTLTVRYEKQWYDKNRSGFMTDNWIGGHGTLNGTNAGLTETHILSPNAVNEVRIGWNYINDGNLPLNNQIIDALNAVPGGIIAPGYPAVSMRNIQSTKAVRPLTTLPNPYYVWQNSLEYMDNLSWHKGNHAIKVGVVYNYNRNDVGGGGAAGGIKFSVDGYMTVASVGAKRPSNLTGTAEALLGMANALTTYEYFDKARMRDHRFAAFIQDDWRVTRKLSLNLGLRYEYSPNWTMKNDTVTNFDLATGQILVPESGRPFLEDQVGLPNGDLPSTYSYVPLDQVLPRNTGVDLAPRFGLAYALTNRLVLRANYGIFMTPPQALSMNNMEGAPFSFEVQVTGDNATPVLVTQGFPASNVFDTLASNDIPPTQYDLKYRTPTVQKFGANLQFMPFSKTVLEVGYEGNHAVRLDDGWLLNYPTPAPGDINARRPYPQWGEGFGLSFQGYSHYNALQVSWRQQLWHGLSVQSALTVEHSYGDFSSEDPYNFSYGYGMLPTDYGHQWNTAAIYDIPTPGTWSRLLTTVAGGWEGSFVVMLRGGLPFSIASSQTMNDDIDASRADLLLTNGPAALPNSQRTIDRWFNTDAFATPPDYTWGNSGYDILRGPGFAQVDAAMQKTFPIGERFRTTFRAEATNLFNRVNLGQPSATLGSSGFGTIRSLGGDPRMMQMVLRIAF